MDTAVDATDVMIGQEVPHRRYGGAFGDGNDHSGPEHGGFAYAEPGSTHQPTGKKVRWRLQSKREYMRQNFIWDHGPVCKSRVVFL